MPNTRQELILLLALALPACVKSPSTTPNTGAGLPPELVFCRTNGSSATTSEIAVRTVHNLGTGRLAERSGRELGVRVHPDGQRVVFARERTVGNRNTRELVLSSIDGSLADTQITANGVADDRPCWSPTGDRILFATARDGESRLYLADADGSNPRPFVSAGAGIEDGDPDWSRATDRVVFSRRDASGIRRLMLANGDGSGVVPLTVGTIAAPGDSAGGDRDPAFAPDGSHVAFVRLVEPAGGSLLSVELANGATTPLFAPLGSVRHPRFSPAADRIFCGVAEAAVGRAGLRLTAVRADGSDALLIEPGEQWLLDGVDVLPALAPAPAAAAAEVLSGTQASVEVASGFVVQGDRQQLGAVDGDSLVLATTTFAGHEVAGINCRFTLPVVEVGDLLAVRVTITAKVTRADGDTELRSSLHNPVAGRFDTVAELATPGTGMRTLAFATQSLAHVSTQRQIRVTVIGEIGAGARAELHVDHVGVTFIRKAPQPR